ncbi:MAG: nucleotidyltransferase family protein [Euryarchaeota archaeon]|nr:nucleotidyltransferase family protein [Euryarchaeota archaeon]
MRTDMTHPDKAQEASLREILEILRLNMSILAERYKVKYIGVFGSQVRGEAREDSDIDILVEFAEAPDLFRFMDLEDDLAALLGRRVDLVTKRALKGNIGRRIMNEVVSV